jgi:hypothetical protein
MSADTYANSQSTSTEHAISYIGVEATGNVFSRHPRLSQGAKHLVAVILRHLNRKDMLLSRRRAARARDGTLLSMDQGVQARPGGDRPPRA